MISLSNHKTSWEVLDARSTTAVAKGVRPVYISGFVRCVQCVNGRTLLSVLCDRALRASRDHFQISPHLVPTVLGPSVPEEQQITSVTSDDKHCLLSRFQAAAQEGQRTLRLSFRDGAIVAYAAEAL